MAKTLVKNIGCLYSGDIKEPVLKADSILIEDGKIVEVGNGLSCADHGFLDPLKKFYCAFGGLCCLLRGFLPPRE